MKLLEEMNDEEVVALDDAGIEKLVQFEAANQGLKPAARPLELQIKRPSIAKTTQGFKLGDIIFEKQEDAIAVARMPRFKEGYDYRSGYSLRWLEAADDAQVTTVVYYEKADIMANVAELRQLEEDKKASEEGTKAYQEYQSGIASIKNEVWTRFWKAQHKMEELKHAKAKFEEFKELADGDEKVAKRFFIKGFAGKEDVLVAVLGQGWNLEVGDASEA